MRASIFVSAAVVAVASAQSSSVDPFPQTSLLAQTDSRGVVTGMFPVATSQPGQPGQPAVVTSQPAVVTTQPAPANIPAVGSGITTLVLQGTGSAFNQTRTVVVSANNSTTVELVRSTPASGSGAGATGSGASGASGSGSRPTGSAASSGSGAASTGAASSLQIASGSLVGFGALFAAFL